MKILRKLLHKLAHLLRMNYGVCESFYDGDKLMMSFVCSGCKKRQNVFHCDGIVDRELTPSTK